MLQALSPSLRTDKRRKENLKRNWKKFLEVKTNKIDKAGFFFFKSSMLTIIRHSEIKMMVKKSDSNQGTTSGCFRGS